MSDIPENEKNATWAFFDFEEESKAFNASLVQKIRDEQREFVRNHISDENMQRFRHGTAWTYRADEDVGAGQLQTISSGWTVRFEDIIDGDLSIIKANITSVAEDMRDQFLRMMYSTISETCDRVGNVVDGRQAGSMAASFVEMLRKIELSVGRDGQVHMPEIHVSPETGERMMKELQAQPPEFEAEVERIKAEKFAAAHERERLRKSKFKHFGKTSE